MKHFLLALLLVPGMVKASDSDDEFSNSHTNATTSSVDSSGYGSAHSANALHLACSIVGRSGVRTTPPATRPAPQQGTVSIANASTKEWSIVGKDNEGNATITTTDNSLDVLRVACAAGPDRKDTFPEAAFRATASTTARMVTAVASTVDTTTQVTREFCNNPGLHIARIGFGFATSIRPLPTSAQPALPATEEVD